MQRHLHSILYGQWAMLPEAAQAHMPYVLNLLKGGSMPTPTKEQLQTARAGQGPRMAADTAEGSEAGSTTPPDQQQENVTVLSLNGPVLKYGGLCSYGTVDFAYWLRQADNDENVVAIVLDLDTPGGELGGMTLLHDALKNTRKPVVCSVSSGMAASAGMGIAAACTEIYASRSTDRFGSIGMFCTLPDFKKYFAKEGLDIHEVYATLSTAKNLEVREALKANPDNPDDEHYDLLRKDHIDPLTEAFIADILADRPQMAATRKQWGNGQLLRADAALKAGLIDGFKNLDEAIDRARELGRAQRAAQAKAQASNHTTTATHTDMNIKERLAGFITGVKNIFSSAEEVTEETIAAVNTELKANGLDQLEVMHSDKAKAVAQAEQDIATAQAKATEADEKATALQASVDDLTAKLQAKEAELAEKVTALADATTKADQLTKDLDAAKADITAKDAEIAKLKNQPAEDGQAANALNQTGDNDPAHKPDEQSIAFANEVKQGLAQLG